MTLLSLSVGAIVGISVAAAVVLVLIIFIIATYNSLVSNRNACEVAYSDMDIYLKKRFDLIPNLVETVKGYAKHESEVLTKITEARARVSAAKDADEKIKAEADLSRALRSINIVAENYPALKADSSFLNLQNSLSSVEADIANSRRYYNARAGAYNEKLLKFPTNLVAGAFKFKARALYEVDDPAERQNVKVSF